MTSIILYSDLEIQASAQELVINTSVSSKGSGESAHMCSLEEPLLLPYTQYGSSDL